jgi:hypothetical protein
LKSYFEHEKLRVLIAGITLFFAFCILGVVIFLNGNSHLTESLYSKGIYPLFVSIYSPLVDIVPFSLTELILILISPVLFVGVLQICFVLFGIASYGIGVFVKLVYLKLSKRTPLITAFNTIKPVFGWHRIISWSLNVIIGVSFIFIVFEVNWGMNYFRVPLEDKAYLGGTYNATMAESDDHYYMILESLIYYVNHSYLGQINMEAPLPYDFNTLNEEIHEQLEKVIMDLEGCVLHTSRKMKTSWMQLLEQFFVSGVISPFLLESHYAKDLFYFEIPFTLAHEKSHLQGYAFESDCNFLAFVTCQRSKNPYIQYSGYVGMLRYFMNALDDPQTYQSYMAQIRPEVRYEFYRSWERYMYKLPVLHQINTVVYHTYLQMNQIPEGIVNYSRVIQLVMGFWHVLGIEDHSIINVSIHSSSE